MSTIELECTVAQYEAMERLIMSDCPETEYLKQIITQIDDPRFGTQKPERARA